MRALIFWDIYGRIGREAFLKNLSLLREKYSPDFIFVNADNISSGRWPIKKHIWEFENTWIDVIFTGDHIFDNEEDIKANLNSSYSLLIRPANFYESAQYKMPWVWYKIIEKKEKKILVIHLLGQVFMKYEVYNPFLKLEEILTEFSQEKFDAVFVDFHRETSAEIYGMGFMFDGRLSLLYWTHTHIQTNDEQILPLWTWMITDVWMTGPRFSVIGADYKSVEKRFQTGIIKWRIEQSLDKNYILNALIADIDEKTWKCIFIDKISIKDKL